jgi:hypothetical protein
LESAGIVVPEVNGEGALEAKEFVPTLHELSIIATYWLREVRKIQFDYFWNEELDIPEDLILSFGVRRVNRTWKVLGDDAMQRIERDVMSELAAEVNPELWKLYLSNEEPERDEQGLSVFPLRRGCTESTMVEEIDSSAGSRD